MFLGFFDNPFHYSAMTFKSSSGRKFAQTVTDHIFGDININKFTAIMNAKISTDKFGSNLTATRICIDGVFGFSNFF